ncbi:uncharacterized protein F4822DRAFT_98593 [Hypoxylon trugodes]|uniref:uncharacterized protein n=1 Tax=Hypoxylon trugodes TaxID=326681 RepID=UPI0021914594|nr:uncharacterized protein F4822DRAFT_98593 [Hypoxylon trugodes]KAI1382846.1 hypothetical protein F4822DRAFT_98593 [Hypoxylon trugodes]
MHLTTVARDIESTKSVVRQVEGNAMLQSDSIGPPMREIHGLANKLNELIVKQEANTKKGQGFRLFAHSFAKGPKEQKQLEQLKNDLVQHKNTLVLCIVANLAPSGVTLDIKGVKMDGVAVLQNGRVIQTPEDKDFDRITISNVSMGGASFMNNSAVNQEQQSRLLEEADKRAKREGLLQLIAGPGVPDELKPQIFQFVRTMY